MPPPDPTYSHTGSLEGDASEVLALVQRAALVDGASALDEQQRFDIRRPGDRTLDYVVARDGKQVLAVAMAERSGTAATGALVVDPVQRRRGIATGLVSALVVAVPATLQVWAHGDLPGARRLAARSGFEPVRELWLMRLEPLGQSARAEPRLADGVVLRTFEPGRDEDAWVRLNADAFADHPEQGRLTRADLEQRMTEPWFEPGGFFLAEKNGRLLGFHWTKLESDDAERIGEIYVLGVAPQAQGLGLGKALALTGLRHLADRGSSAVELYVEASNPAAIGLYDKLGFGHVRSDVLYERAPQAPEH